MPDTVNTQVLIAGAGPVGRVARRPRRHRLDTDALDGFLHNIFG
ncbi:hypothetical protein [Mycolicibacterium baixiangningiae]|nr:hypothetical protein [Mycolicibacterium baixiangningiae]